MSADNRSLLLGEQPPQTEVAGSGAVGVYGGHARSGQGATDVGRGLLIVGAGGLGRKANGSGAWMGPSDGPAGSCGSDSTVNTLGTPGGLA